MEHDKAMPGQPHETLMVKTFYLNMRVLALAIGLICGLAIFIATNWLVIKGGDPVGPHLQLLGQFFWGYRVTFAGSLIGSGYGFVTGWLCGLAIGWIYNRIALGNNTPRP